MAEARRSIVFLAPGFSEPGGCARHGRKLAEELAERGWEVRVIAQLGSGVRMRRMHRGNLTVLEIPGFGRRRLGGLLFIALAFPLALRTRNPWAFMAMQLSAPATVASIAARIKRCERLVVFSTSVGPAGEAAFVERSRVRALRLWLLRRSSALVAQTEQGEAELRTLLPESEIVVVPTPVRLHTPVPPKGNPASVAYTGRIVRGKNLDVLLALWEGIATHVPDAHLTLVGEGWPGDPIEGLLRRQISDNILLSSTVTITGWVPDVTPYLLESDVFVLPSSSEGMSNALLEACALGRVVAASDIPANRAILGKRYPLVFDHFDHEQFARALVQAMVDDSIRHEARTQILGRVERFSVPNVVDRLESVLLG